MHYAAPRLYCQGHQAVWEAQYFESDACDSSDDVRCCWVGTYAVKPVLLCMECHRRLTRYGVAYSFTAPEDLSQERSCHAL